SLPEGGFRAMCTWERFCAFAREPERRKVGGDARITVEGVVYEVDPELAGETVVLWWGLFDRDLFVEHGERRFGPCRPSGGPIPLHRYLRPKRTAHDERAGRIAAEERAAIDAILGETLERGTVLARVRARFATPRSGDGRC